MPRTKAPKTGPVSLPEVIANRDIYLETLVRMATEELLDYSHPDNPQDHHEDEDIPEIAKVLLYAGWQEIGISLNINTSLLTGGHGRVLAAEMNLNQGQEYFDAQWELWLKDKERKELAERAKERFCPDYWRFCPVWITEISSTDQKAMLIRLNDQRKDGAVNRAKMAALMSQLDSKRVDMAGWDMSTRNIFVEAYMIKAPPPEPERPQVDLSGYDFDAGLPPEEGTEYQEGQRFEHPDATDYSQDGGDEDWEEEEPVIITTADGTQAMVADIGEIAEDFQVSQVNYDTDIRETRAVLLMSQGQLQQFKDYFGASTKPGVVIFVLEKLGVEIDTGRSIKEWRPDANLAVLEAFLKQNQELVDQYQAQQAKKAEKSDDNPEETPPDED